MVCVFCFEIDFPETDWNTCSAIVNESFPESRIIAIAPAPDGEAKATIVSCEIISKILSKLLKLNKYFLKINCVN